MRKKFQFFFLLLLHLRRFHKKIEYVKSVFKVKYMGKIFFSNFFLASASREISFEDRQCRVHSLRSCKYKKIIIFFSAFAFMVVSLEDNAVSLHQGKVNETFFILSFFLLYNLPFILFLRY